MKALITGITGQDGAYLAELLLAKGYEVHGIKRRASSLNTQRLDGFIDSLHLHYGDLSDSANLLHIIQQVQPDEVYNLGAMSHVAVSFEQPEYTADINGLGTLRLLEALRILNSKARFYQASTSELFGAAAAPQNESTPFYPRSPYAVAKLFGYWTVVNYREAYGMHASNGLLFNHEGPTRGETFVTRKIAKCVAGIYKRMKQHSDTWPMLRLGNLNAKRDWGHAKDYVRAMYLILQQDKPDDYVIATGITTSVRDFVRKAFAVVGMQLEFIGSGLAEAGVVNDGSYSRAVVSVDPRQFRPTEVDLLCGDASKARAKLGWEPQYTLDDIVKEMVEAEL